MNNRSKQLTLDLLTFTFLDENKGVLYIRRNNTHGINDGGGKGQ